MAMESSVTYWVRTTVGLEDIFAGELKGKFPAKRYATGHRSVFFELEEHVSESVLCSSLRTADDIYRLIGQVGGIDNTKQSVNSITAYFGEHVVPAVTPSSRVRVTVSFLGDRNFNRFFVENQLNEMLVAQRGSIILSNEEGHKWVKDEVRIRLHIEDDQCYFGIGLQDKPLHRRQWRGESYAAQLHPPLAAAMAMIAAPKPGMKLIDPFCGSGTILIESALQNGSVQLAGYDIDPAAISIATQNARNAGVEINFHTGDFVDQYKNAREFILVSNPPWGGKHDIGDKAFFTNIQRYIDSSTSTVLLVPEDLKSELKNLNKQMKEICVTRVRGKLASVVQISPLA